MNVLASIVLVFLLAEGYEAKKCTCKAVKNMLGELEDKLKAIITTKVNDLENKLVSHIEEEGPTTAEGYEGKKCTCKVVENMLGELEDKLKTIITAKMSELVKLEARIAISEEPTTDECTASNYLLTGPNQVLDQALTSSSSFKPTLFTTKYSRLRTVETSTHGTGAWSAKNNDINQWIQARFENPKTVKGIAVQGRDIPNHPENQYVTEFTVSYSTDCQNFQYVANSDGRVVKFVGNTDTTSVVTRLFPTPVAALCVRLHPTQWNQHISLRWDIISC